MLFISNLFYLGAAVSCLTFIYDYNNKIKGSGIHHYHWWIMNQVDTGLKLINLPFVKTKNNNDMHQTGSYKQRIGQQKWSKFLLKVSLSQCNVLPSLTEWAVWPDLAKLRHFSTIIKGLAKFFEALFSIWHNFNPTLAKNCYWASFYCYRCPSNFKII